MPTPTRQLCERCLESFSPEEGETICASCRARENRPRSDVARAPAATPLAATPIAATPRDGANEEAPLPFFPAAKEWCQGRLPWFRGVLWLYLGATFFRHLVSDEPYRSLFDGINLGIHEFGHAIFRPLGEWFHVAGGTITQLAAPIAGGAMFWRQKDFFGLSVAACWLATNLWGVSVYLGDARALELPLVAPGMGMMPGGDTSGAGGIIHDWNYLLGAPGLLKYDTLISGGLAFLAVVVMGAGLIFGGWLLVEMARSKSPPKFDFEEF